MSGKRITREKNTIQAMVKLFCEGHHCPEKNQLCPQCTEFAEYALKRLDKCQFQEDKPTCANCTVHCYKPDRREQAKTIMRYSGPKMILHYPLLAIHHTLDGLKKTNP
ncbi:MAG: nitrous oxide-stimulated promoter family protein [Nitrospirae bacterium]|nr:nitrous oxide-stimulated promoter family protein [Nitrospirota bacterium]MBF0540783.1 nitrous oxide-stimulated promoter family protein [Nitrospirota bacterium]